MAQTNKIAEYVLESFNSFNFYSSYFPEMNNMQEGTSFTKIFDSRRVTSVCRPNKDKILIYNEKRNLSDLSRIYNPDVFPESIDHLAVIHQMSNGFMCNKCEIMMRDDIDMSTLNETLKRNEYQTTVRLKVRPEFRKILSDSDICRFSEAVIKKRMFSRESETLLLFSGKSFLFNETGYIKPNARGMRIIDNYIERIA